MSGSSPSFDRVWKTMIQMYGPHWVERWGATNDAWSEALKELNYSQVTHGLKAVRNSGMKYFECDLPGFIKLCRPTLPTVQQAPIESKQAPWASGMPEDEIPLHRFACFRFLAFLLGPGTSPNCPMEQDALDACTASLHRIAHEFYEMRKELGDEQVPDSDLAKALDRQWRRDMQLGVSA